MPVFLPHPIFTCHRVSGGIKEKKDPNPISRTSGLEHYHGFWIFVDIFSGKDSDNEQGIFAN